MLPTLIDYVGDGPDIITRLHFDRNMNIGVKPPLGLFHVWMNGVSNYVEDGYWTDNRTYTLYREKGFPPTLWELSYDGGNVNFISADGTLVGAIERQEVHPA
jgi:hypothetical protein